MGKMESIIKSEIQRLAKKEIRQTSASMARDIRVLKNKVVQLRKMVSLLERSKSQEKKGAGLKKITLEASTEEVKSSRFSPRLFRSLRGHLGISQRELAFLVGVSIGTVHQWEAGKFRPKEEKKKMLVALRRLGRQEVRRLLEEKAVQQKKK
jgi:DNA-binding transcriptional regulator YiaG